MAQDVRHDIGVRCFCTRNWGYAMNKYMIAAALTALLLAYFFRYEIHPTNTQTVAYKLDRWTGAVTVIVFNKEQPVTRQD